MTTQNNLEENKRIVRAFIETAFNQHQTDRVADHLTVDMKWHGGTLGTVEGRDNFVGLVGAIVSALPDLRNVEQDIIAERDIVSVRAVVEGRLRDVPTRRDPVFGVHVPSQVPGVPSDVLDPRGAWPDPDDYDRQARTLRAMFDENIGRIGQAASAAG